MESEVPEFQFVPLSTIVAPARREFRSLLTDIGKWSLRNGRSADLDVIALILVSKAEKEVDSDFFYWKRTSIYSDLWARAFNYCSFRRGFIPENVGEQMWIFLDYLVDTDKLDDNSDPISALREPLNCYWWLDRNGITRTDEDGRYKPCRCRLDYKGKPHGYYKNRRAKAS